MKEVNEMQKQYLSIYAAMKDEEAFLKVWDEFKDRITGIKDTMEVMKYVKAFKKPCSAQ